MPIKIPNNLPAAKVLESENIFVMSETRAITQDIRPLKILILNLLKSHRAKKLTVCIEKFSPITFFGNVVFV